MVNPAWGKENSLLVLFTSYHIWNRKKGNIPNRRVNELKKIACKLAWCLYRVNYLWDLPLRQHEKVCLASDFARGFTNRISINYWCRLHVYFPGKSLQKVKGGFCNWTIERQMQKWGNLNPFHGNDNFFLLRLSRSFGCVLCNFAVAICNDKYN